MSMAIERTGGIATRPNVYRRWLLVPVGLLTLLSLYLFVKFIHAWAAYTGWGPVTDIVKANRIHDLIYSYHQAQVLFSFAASTVAVAAIVLTPRIKVCGVVQKPPRSSRDTCWR
jgi:hypothetical protein